MRDGRVRVIQQKLSALKEFVSNLDKTIVDNDARDFLLHSARNSLSDAESYLLPQGLRAKTAGNAAMWFRILEFQVQLAEKELKHAQDMVSKYGPNLRVIG